MQSDVPKQYLMLDGSTVLDQTLRVLLDSALFRAVVVVISPGDRYWGSSVYASDTRVLSAAGGATRCRSVLNGLRRLDDLADPDDRVAVHDAVRPCLPRSDLRALLAAAVHDDGALLATPVTDTLKCAGAGEVVERTLVRDGIWRALTPQVFPLAALTAALAQAIARGVEPTDEAQAMELCGARPRLVSGSVDNIKITRPGDLAVAGALLAARARAAV